MITGNIHGVPIKVSVACSFLTSNGTRARPKDRHKQMPVRIMLKIDQPFLFDRRWKIVRKRSTMPEQANA